MRPSSAPPGPAIAAVAPPKPPSSTEAIERFMALAIWSVRIVPLAPTSMPATIKAVLSSATPAAAALSPVKAFRVEMTTGMSAPPIGSTASTPSAPAATSRTMKTSSLSEPATITTPAAMAMISSAPLMNTPPGSFSGLPEMSSCSLPKAMFEPQKEIDPTIAANTSGMPTSRSVRSPPCSRNSAHAISAIAPPPTPLNRATICGIAVIFTLRAAGTPMTVPITIPSAIRPQLPVSSRSSVAMTATAMPTAAVRLPRTAVVGEVSCARPMMNRLKATM